MMMYRGQPIENGGYEKNKAADITTYGVPIIEIVKILSKEHTLYIPERHIGEVIYNKNKSSL
jgi:hypothetical protein